MDKSVVSPFFLTHGVYAYFWYVDCEYSVKFFSILITGKFWAKVH